jgi:hypothetical protein
VKNVFLVALAALTSACAPELYLVSPAPPTRVVTVNQGSDRIELSEGVAVAVECLREGFPCKDVKATTDQPAVAKVFPAHIAQVHQGYYAQTNVSSLALMGIRPGTTKLHVVADGSSTDYTVTVLPAK